MRSFRRLTRLCEMLNESNSRLLAAAAAADDVDAWLLVFACETATVFKLLLDEVEEEEEEEAKWLVRCLFVGGASRRLSPPSMSASLSELDASMM